ELDTKIDRLMRDKLFSLMGENAVRIKKVNVKYTKGNKKNSLERCQALYDSYDRLLRSIPKDLFRVEREVRVKFTSPMTNERMIQVKSMINQEGEVLFRKMEDECREEFKKIGQTEEFDRRQEQSRTKFGENSESHAQKCWDAVNGDHGQSEKLDIKDLVEIYGIKESLLHEINIIPLLQNIHLNLGKLKNGAGLNPALDSIHNGFRFLFQYLQKGHSQEFASPQERKARKMQVARDSMAVREVVLSAQHFIEQLILPRERRNREIINKAWRKIVDILEGSGEGWEQVIPDFKPLYELIEDKEN
ncbi:MAG: hypothetical protein GWO41_07930, partial [candidate division Zixibacteria bacterium]|nr:hypothetical protein [candidate division Zixibacteria bacterium]